MLKTHSPFWKQLRITLILSFAMLEYLYIIKDLKIKLKGNSGQNFFLKKLHSSYRALKCEKNPFCFILITFFVQKLLKF